MLRMDQVHVIRHKVLVEGQSGRAVALQMGVSRNTVRKYLEVSAPVRRESRARARPVLEAVTARMEALLEQWSLRSTFKQRVTGSRFAPGAGRGGLSGRGDDGSLLPSGEAPAGG
jgi:transposase